MADNNLKASTSHTFYQKIYNEVKIIVPIHINVLAKNVLYLMDGNTLL